jgi:hypothetical protein
MLLQTRQILREILHFIKETMDEIQEFYQWSLLPHPLPTRGWKLYMLVIWIIEMAKVYWHHSPLNIHHHLRLPCLMHHSPNGVNIILGIWAMRDLILDGSMRTVMVLEVGKSREIVLFCCCTLY